MFIIGIDPHKARHTAAVIDRDEIVHAQLHVRADRQQRSPLLEFAAPFTPRVWAVEGASGTGALLAQQLVAAGEIVFDVPGALTARVWLLDSGHKDKTDLRDARAAAIVALRHRNLRDVEAEDHVMILRLLARRHHQLIAGRTRAITRVHALVCEMVEGGLPRRLSAARAAAELRRVRGRDLVTLERNRLAAELLEEVRRHDKALRELRTRIVAAVHPSGTTITEICGVGPIVAAYVIGYTGNIDRFPSRGHYARYNATAPIEASSGPKARHRLNPNGNRRLNHAMHMIAVTQVRNDTPRRAYYLAKPAAGKTSKEAMRCLKRRISDSIYAHLHADATR